MECVGLAGNQDLSVHRRKNMTSGEQLSDSAAVIDLSYITVETIH